MSILRTSSTAHQHYTHLAYTLLRFAIISLLALYMFAVASMEADAATWNVTAGADLQSVINAAQPGDTILLEAGTVFVGPFTLPKKTGDDWITIRTSTPDSALPPAGTRISPAHASLMPKLVSPGNADPALQTAAGAHHYRLVGIEFRPIDATVTLFDLVKLGDGSLAQNTLEKVPHHLVIERCYLHGFTEQPAKRGVALNSASTDILDSYFAEFKERGQDSQAIGG
ncbi:MAG TPA: hypothetical protein VF754_07300, partial [Pyrinomonadaceae bacterium]